MRFNSIFQHLRLRPILIIAITVTATLILSGFVWLTSAMPKNPSSAKVAIELQGQEKSNANRVEVELIRVRPTGFEPKEISRPAGRFLLAVNDLTGLKEVTLQLEREGAGRLDQARTSDGKRNWRKVIELPAGRYILSEVNHPEWVCRITIADN